VRLRVQTQEPKTNKQTKAMKMDLNMYVRLNELSKFMNVGMAQVVEPLSIKHEALSSYSSTAKK
jgi:hypothetical protein